MPRWKLSKMRLKAAIPVNWMTDPQGLGDAKFRVKRSPKAANFGDSLDRPRETDLGSYLGARGKRVRRTHQRPRQVIHMTWRRDRATIWSS